MAAELQRTLSQAPGSVNWAARHRTEQQPRLKCTFLRFQMLSTSASKVGLSIIASTSTRVPLSRAQPSLPSTPAWQRARTPFWSDY